MKAAAAHAVGVGAWGRGRGRLMAEGGLQVWSGDAKQTGQAGIYQVVGVHRLDVTGSRLQPGLQNSTKLLFRSGDDSKAAKRQHTVEVPAHLRFVWRPGRLLARKD